MNDVVYGALECSLIHSNSPDHLHFSCVNMVILRQGTRGTIMSVGALSNAIHRT